MLNPMSHIVTRAILMKMLTEGSGPFFDLSSLRSVIVERRDTKAHATIAITMVTAVPIQLMCVSASSQPLKSSIKEFRSMNLL